MTTNAADRLFSDMHKDAYGFRPSHSTWQAWALMTDAQLDIEQERLQRAVDESIDNDARAQRAAAVKFEAAIADIMAVGNVSRETAIRWNMDAVGAEDDIGYYEYQWNLPYGYVEHGRRA
jgi:hypothetical protein